MKRRIFNILAVISLLLFVVSSTLWIRSMWKYDSLTYTVERRPESGWMFRQWKVVSDRGGILIFLSKAITPADNLAWVRNMDEYYKWHPRGLEFQTDRAATYPFAGMNVEPSVWRSMGFEVGVHHTLSGQNDGIDVWNWSAVIPYWLVCGAFILLPITQLGYIVRRRNRAQMNLCPACGYDLRASPGRCPECGTVPARKAATSK